MFWDDIDLVKKKNARVHVAPPVPNTGWIKPDNPPNLSNAEIISFDTETKDPTLSNEGPGWSRGKSHIIGISIGAQDRLGNRGAWYFPIRHEFEPEDNLPVNEVLDWIGQVLNTPHIRKVGANLTYDIGNLTAEGIKVSGQLDDVQFAEALIDSEAFVALETLGHKYCNRGKLTDHLREWLKIAYPNTQNSEWKNDLYRSPPRLVAPYAIEDANLPLDVHYQQLPILQAEELMTVYRMECDLIPLMIRMRFRGITVDVNKAEEMIASIEKDTRDLYSKIYHIYGYNLQSSDSRQVAKLLDHVGISVPRTAEGNPSVTKEWLASQDNEVTNAINNIREHEKMVSTFLKGYIINGNINGKLHPQFHQLKGDSNGTLVGRYSSSDPNLQNIPARTELGKKIRTCFVPEKGNFGWRKFDQSQVHYRILAHYAVGPGSDELRYRYNNDPATDYHWDVYKNVAPYMEWLLDDDKLNEFRRRPIKNVNFGLLYGQTEKALAKKVASYFGAGFTNDQIKQFFKSYFEGAPYVKPTVKHIGAEVQAFGFVTTLLGRRIRFNLFEPARREKGEYFQPLPYEMAIQEYGAPLKRAYEYRGVNYKFQGSEPDIIKKGLLDCWNSGVFDYTDVPNVTVHDEIDFDVIDDTEITRQAFAFVRQCMVNCIQLRVPLKVDEEFSPYSWGEVEKVKKSS